jgi:hypothetical protein
MPAHQIITIIAIAVGAGLIPLVLALLIRVTPDDQTFWEA